MPKDTDAKWMAQRRNRINVGPQFQAAVPDVLQEQEREGATSAAQSSSNGYRTAFSSTGGTVLPWAHGRGEEDEEAGVTGNCISTNRSNEFGEFKDCNSLRGQERSKMEAEIAPTGIDPTQQHGNDDDRHHRLDKKRGEDDVAAAVIQNQWRGRIERLRDNGSSVAGPDCKRRKVAETRNVVEATSKDAVLPGPAHHPPPPPAAATDADAAAVLPETSAAAAAAGGDGGSGSESSTAK
eukprot:GHVU01130593.1.p1 GENE.GHVU01130593.1~~GHVU01130593.1.p1  ORF type:complete len:238 (-),score=55.10 GHVU01130593.1:85-798(-)